MILEFAVQNFKSFKELQVFSFEASNEAEEDDHAQRVVQIEGGYRVVKTKAIYGANASGKTNLILGLVALWKIINNNLKYENIFQTFVSPYRLDSVCLNEPSYFQIIFTHEGNRYRYGIEVDKERVHAEWLYLKKKKEVVLFEREGDKITELNETTFKEGKLIRQGLKMFTDKTLVVSVLDQLNGPISSIVKACITDKISISANLHFYDRNNWYMETMHYFERDLGFQHWTTNLLKAMDGSIVDTAIDEINLPNGEIEKIPIIVRNANNGQVSFILQKEEASGTKKMFDYSSVIYRSLRDGKTLIIDEMDALLHPKLTRTIIQLFHSPEAHKEAQLIFATHDTNLMDYGLLRRDQIVFVEKSKSGQSELFGLSDIKGVRATDLFEKNYLKGNYGAIPILNSLEKLLLNKNTANA